MNIFLRFFSFLTFFALVLFPARVVFAYDLDSIYAVPTTNLSGATANYTFYFTVDSLSSWSSGEVMTLVFPSGYSLGLMNEDDVDFAVNGTDFTTASDCSGTEHVGVSFSSLKVTFEMCAGDGGSVSSGSLIVLEMGLHASASGMGAHAVTNPSDLGSYFLALDDTFGDAGSVVVPIVSRSSSGVSVTIPEVTPPEEEEETDDSSSSSGGDRPDPRDDSGDDEGDLDGGIDKGEGGDLGEGEGGEEGDSGDLGDGEDSGGGDESTNPDVGDGGSSGGGDGDVPVSGGGGSSGGGDSDGEGDTAGGGDASDSGDGSDDGDGEGEGDELDELDNGGDGAGDDSDENGGGSGEVDEVIDREVIGGDAGTSPDSGEGSFYEDFVLVSGGVVSSIGNAIASVGDIYVSAVEELFSEPSFESAVTVASPVVFTSAVATTVAVSGGQFALYLYSFFSQPLLFFTRKKYQKFGVVYHAITKVPLDLVTVRAYDVKTNRLVSSAVSNERGEFILKVPREGVYRLQAVKPQFSYPSVYLQDVQEDGVYAHVYTGQHIEVTDIASPIAVSLPLDPVGEAPVPVKSLQWRRMKRRLALLLSPASIFFALALCVFYPGSFSYFILLFQIFLYALTWKIAHRKHRAGWGVVYDSVSRLPVNNVVIRLFEPKYNKLVESTLSDGQGRYAFALGPNEYYVTFEKKGYLDATVKPIDYRPRKEISFFGVNIPLRRHDARSHG